MIHPKNKACKHVFRESEPNETDEPKSDVDIRIDLKSAEHVVPDTLGKIWYLADEAE